MTPPTWAATFGEQAPAIDVAAWLATTFGHLPPAYMSINATFPDRLTLQPGSLPAFELWRKTLQIPAESVVLQPYIGDSSLTVETTIHGVFVQLYVSGVLLTGDVARVSPGEDSIRRAHVAEQRKLADAALLDQTLVLPVAGAAGGAV
jgi:hypothetical protein